MQPTFNKQFGFYAIKTGELLFGVEQIEIPLIQQVLKQYNTYEKYHPTIKDK